MVRNHGAKVTGGLQECRPPPLGGRSQRNVELDGVGTQVGKQPELAGGFEHHALAVRGGVAHIEIFVIGVAAQPAAVGEHRVQVPVAFVVGKEGHPPVNPHGIRQVAVQFRDEAFELAVAVGVDPELSGGSAAVALPPGRLA